MKRLYCWRCREVVPMLDEDEYAEVHALYGECMDALKDTENRRVADNGIDLFRPVREAYSRLTGAPEMHHNAIMHHRVAIYGPPCADCGKPLRTPQARFCAACGSLSSLSGHNPASDILERPGPPNPGPGA